MPLARRLPAPLPSFLVAGATGSPPILLAAVVFAADPVLSADLPPIEVEPPSARRSVRSPAAARLRPICSLPIQLTAGRSMVSPPVSMVMLTILTQLEIGEVQYLKLLPEMKVTCTVNFHHTSPGALALKDLLVAAILKKSELRDGQYVFDIPNVANSLGLHPSDLSNHLYELKVRKLDAMYNAAAFAVNSCNKADGCGDGQHTPYLTRIISEYFNKDDD